MTNNDEHNDDFIRFCLKRNEEDFKHGTCNEIEYEEMKLYLLNSLKVRECNAP